MDLNLYSCFKEANTLKKKLKDAQTQLRMKEMKQRISEENKKLKNLVNLINSIIETQEKILNKRASTVLAIEDLQTNSRGLQTMQLPYTCHKDFISILTNLEKTREFISNCSQHTKYNSEDLKTVVNNIQDAHGFWDEQLTNDLNKYRSVKGFFENVQQIKKFEFDLGEEDEPSSDADLGCKILETSSIGTNSLENFNVSASQFITSSPISSIKLKNTESTL